MTQIFVLDALGYLYRSYYAIRNMTDSKGQSTGALYGFIRSIQKLQKDFSPQHLVIVFDGPNSLHGRLNLYADYKQHRKETPADLFPQIAWAQEYCVAAGLSFLSLPNVEADDTMGSIAVWSKQEGLTTFLCTSDKDLCQFVDGSTFILNTHKDNQILDAAKVQEVFGVPPERIVDYLAITGDASDNVPGLPGFGPKSAAALLQEFGSLKELLDHPERLKGEKKQEVVRTHRHMAELSYQLVTINTRVDIPKTLDFYQIASANRAVLEDFYRRFNFLSLLKELDTQKGASSQEDIVSYHLVNDEAALQKLALLLSTASEVAFDTETTDVRPMYAELVGIGFCLSPQEAWYVPMNGALTHATILQYLHPIFSNPKIGFYGHNAKYDVHVLSRAGIQIANLSFDTILASYLLNAHSHRHSLDHLALQYFGKVKIDIKTLLGTGKKEITMDQVPLERVCEYCCEDVDYTCRLKERLEGELKERGLTPLLQNLEMPLNRILAQMEENGIFLDPRVLQTFSKELSKKLEALVEKIYAMAGETFNLNSPKQLGDILFSKLNIPPPKKTATGYSTDAEVLESLAVNFPIAGDLLIYRSLEKLRSTYVQALPDTIHPKTGRIHCTYNQYVAATGRLSCQDPNLQNIPVRTEDGKRIREAFRPQQEGWSFLSADYSQIELRLMAHLSEDPKLIEAFLGGEDVHSYTASLVFNLPLGAVTPIQRQHAKAVNFGILYGQQAFGLSKELGISVTEASAFITTYFERYPRVREFIEECKETARKTGKATTLIGRERLLPEIQSKNPQLRAAAERLAINTPLQGSCADLIKLAMIKASDFLKNNALQSMMVLQIHDELVFEAPDKELDALSCGVRAAMEKVWELKVPLVTSIHVGKNWREC